MQTLSWVLAVCLAAAVTARPEGRSPTAEAVRVVESGAPNAIEEAVEHPTAEAVRVVESGAPNAIEEAVEHPKAEVPAFKPMPTDEVKDQAAKPLDESKDAVKEHPLKETQGEDAMKLPVPIEPDFGSPDDPKVFPEGALRSPNAESAVSRVIGEKPALALVPVAVNKKTGRAARAYLPAEARGGDDSDGLERRPTPRQLTDIHHLFLSHPDHAARLSARLSAPQRETVGEGRRAAARPGAARTARRARLGWATAEVDNNDLELVEERDETSADFGDDAQPTRFSLMRDEDAVEQDAALRASDGHATQPVTVTTFIPTITAISTTHADGDALRSSRITWPLASLFPVVIQDPLLGLYHSWASGGGLASIPGNIFEYGPAADICSGSRAKRIRRDKDPVKEGEQVEEDDVHASSDGAASKGEPIAEEGSGEDAEDSLPTESYQEDDDDSDKSPQDVLEKKLRKNKNKVDKRVHKVVAQVNGLTKRLEARLADVLANSGALDNDSSDAGRDDTAVPTLTRVVVRRGGVAVAGPGGIATAAFGGTAIVGPGGIAYTAPDSTAVAGPGARVVAVPSERLLDMFRAFREASERGVAAYRPAWLGSIPDDGKLVAVGPVVYRNPPEEREGDLRPAHWVFGNTRVLGLRR